MRREEELATRTAEDCKTVASYAARFNSFLKSRPDGDNLPSIKVAAPASCDVLYSALPWLRQGDKVVIFPFGSKKVKKFVYDGNEEFVELPQAFFHYVMNASGGKDMVNDLQGTVDDEGEVLLVDPLLVQAPPVTVTNLLASAAAAGGGGRGPASDDFDRLHPRCGQLCKTFDPHRKGTAAKTFCGFHIGACF